VAHPLPEVLLLVVCGTIAGCDDFDDIVEWGNTHLQFLRRFLPFYHGIPSARWVNILMNRMPPEVFSACFLSWARQLRPDAPATIALDGKTSRRSHDRSAGREALHLISAFATAERLVLGQEAVAGKGCEQTAIPQLLEKLAAKDGLDGAIVTIDAIACNPKIAGQILDCGADYVLAVKDNQPTLAAELEAFFDEAPASAIEVHRDLDKGHGRIEERTCTLSHQVDWLSGSKHYPGEPRFPKLAAIARIEARVELKDRCHKQTRYYIASRPLTAKGLAEAVRGHWRIENSLHWVLDVVFREDLARVRKGHGAANMAVVRHFAINLVRAAADQRSLKLRRKLAGWDENYLASLLIPTPR
jgi:predicted transposase YbfD/YdcC